MIEEEVQNGSVERLNLPPPTNIPNLYLHTRETLYEEDLMVEITASAQGGTKTTYTVAGEMETW